MWFLSCHSVVFFGAGCMDWSTSESYFELVEGNHGLDGFCQYLQFQEADQTDLSSGDCCCGAEAVAWICSCSVCM